jgi:hypothetical protein
MKFSNFVPDEVLKYPNSANFLKVLDEVQAVKEAIIYHYSDSCNPLVVKDIAVIAKRLKEYGNVPLSSYMTLAVYECLLLNIERIFSLKGTLNGAKTFYECVSQGTVFIDSSDLIKRPIYIILDDLVNGLLPFADGSDSIIAQDYANYPNDSLFLFDDNIGSLVNSVTITVNSPFHNIPEFRGYILYTIPLMFPAITQDTIINLILNP